MIKTILKRDGERVPFEKEKITIAMRKAFSAQDEKVEGQPEHGRARELSQHVAGEAVRKHEKRV